MKYIIMCGGNYKDEFKTPKQLMKINNEVIIERTIRLLKENGVSDIAISTNNPAFNYLDVEKLRHKNDYLHNAEDRNKKSEHSWLNAYYPIKEPCCYLHGDVYFSDNAIKKIIETEVDDTMFFCTRDYQDGRETGINAKGREPLAYKVKNQIVFRNAINNLLKMIDEGKFAKGVEPISWHLYRYLNGLDLGFGAKDNGFANDIFKQKKGNYIYIDDYTTDIDSIEDIKKIERIIKIVEGGVTMVKCEAIEEFNLGRFNELKNIVRNQKEINHEANKVYYHDVFECSEELAMYLANKTPNPVNRGVIRIIEVIPEEKKEEKQETKQEEVKEPVKEETKRKTTRRKRRI